MTAYNLTTIRPRGFMHASAFTEVKDSLAWALAALGHAVNISENWIDASDTNIIFGTELMAPNQPQALPPGTILYNLEQSTHPSFAKVQSIALGTKAILWDYSLGNIEKHRETGIYAKYVPIGYTPNLTRIPKAEVQDIDCLLYGWLTPRRIKLVQALRDAGLNVVATSKCYGGGRDNLISRAKVVLNVHHDGRELFEIVRVSYLLANGKCVVTEPSIDDAEYADIHKAYLTSKIDGLEDEHLGNFVALCKQLVSGLRQNTWSVLYDDMERISLDLISKRDYVETVRNAISEPTPQEKVAARYAAAKASGDMKDFVEWIKDHAKGTCLEIGTRDGASTSALLSGVEKNGGIVLSVDIDDCSHLFRGHPQWAFIKSDSQNPKLHVPKELDLLLVDGLHTREGYRADLERFYPLVKPGGLILSHDISPDPSLTLEALPGSDRPSKFLRDEYFAFAERYSLEHYQLPGENGLGVIVKPTCIESDESWQASEALVAQ